MKIKKIFIFISLLFLTGCSIDYNLEIDRNRMIENISATIPNTEDNKQIIEHYTNEKTPVYYDIDNGVTEFYNVKKEEINNSVKFDFSYSYSHNQLEKSYAFDRCYYKKSVTKNQQYIIIETGKQVDCFHQDDNKLIDKININITTRLIVEEHNADKVKGNTYIWTINENNIDNKPIYIKIKQEYKEATLIEKIDDYKVILIIAGVILILVGVAYFIVNKNNNEV